MKKLTATAITVSMLASMAAPGVAQTSENIEITEGKQYTEEYLVMACDNEALENIEEEYDNVLDDKLSDAQQAENNNLAVVEVTQRDASQLRSDEDTVYVEKDITLYGMSEKKKKAEGNENYMEYQWNLDAIRLGENKAGNDKIKVAVLDSGCSYSNDIDIVATKNIIAGEEEVNPLFEDSTGHGTAVCSIIGAKDNGEGITGICPEADIYSIKILDDNNETSLSVAVSGIYSAIESGCDIINMSFGTYTDSQILHQAVRDAYDAGILLIAAAGNADGAVMYPAAYDEVMAVGSSDENGEWIETTAGDKKLDILAPGTKILATDSLFGVSVVEGTSFAAAHVTGAAALLWSKDKTKSADYIRRLMVNTSQSVDNSETGLADVQNSLEQNEEFAKTYKEGKIEYPDIECSAKDSEEYDTALINGLWNKTDHLGTAEYAYMGTGISAESKELIKTGSRYPDISPYNSARMYHGAYNYMKALHFVYSAAEEFRKIYKQPEKNLQYEGKTLEVVIQNVIDKAVTKSGFVGNNEDEKNQIAMAKKQYKNMVLAIINETIKSEKTLYYNTNNARRGYYATIGIGMHLIGDIYAHRTMVPAYTIEGTNPSIYEYDTIADDENIKNKIARFGSASFYVDKDHGIADDIILKNWAKNSKSCQPEKVMNYHEAGHICGHWRCFQASVKLGIVEFRDIPFYSIQKGLNSDYTDNKSFCGERYLDAKISCSFFMDFLIRAEKYDGIFILYPVYGNIINNFKNYSLNAKEPYYNDYVTSDWKDWSTSEYK